ncbi:MAG TPA: hypothetical protein VN947_04110 [Polyangia bacterium]|nr:hypothetical protein [Polyangia bacterium]
MPRLLALLLLVSVAACRTPPLDYDGGVPGSTDLAVTNRSHDMRGPTTRDLSGTPISCCGVAGNPGNEDGVGKFCQATMDCLGQKANICATTFAPTLTFCTMACTTNGSNTECGSGAQCQCAQSQCACVPGECVMPPPGC